MKKLIVAMPLILTGFATAATAQTMVPANNGACPSGSNYAGSGYCRSYSRNYVPLNNGACPSGSSYAGSGYCGSQSNTTYVSAQNGSCPSGSSYAGSGYCKLR